MREIKFRTWDGETMWYPETLTADKGNTHFVFYNPQEGIKWGLYDSHYENRLVSGEHYELMQYTGLKDKNGNEIYEGDIIEISHPFDNRNFKGAIEWEGYGFGAKEFYFSHYDNPGDLFSEGTEYIEIIGNIHQHPELLNMKEHFNDIANGRD